MKERYHLGSYQEAVKRALKQAGDQHWARRIWAKDAAVWKSDEPHRKIIEQALGWLNVVEEIQPRLAEIQAFTEQVRKKGLTTACLLGMGGSSLCPEVCSQTFGSAHGYLRLAVLDTTDPAMILQAARGLDLARTLFIVSSKSGTTIESSSLQKYFFEKVRALRGEAAGDQFAAITDSGTPLEELGRDLRFLRVFLNPADIGGRFSALSFFGLVPMSLVGIDLSQMMDRALTMAARCRMEGDPDANVGVRLGATLGALARQGRDKVTFVLSPEIRAYGYWVEQLMAESTGKQGTGIVPVESEELGDPAVYGADRVFVRICVGDHPDVEAETRLKELENAGHPVIHREIEDRYDLAGEFFLWEFATAAAGAVLGINPFDQPNVRESKDNTERLIRSFCETGRLDEGSPLFREGPVSLYADPKRIPARDSLRTALRSFVGTTRPGDYVALLAFLQRSDDHGARLQRIRMRLRDRLKCATTLGFGPRFLHSTGQLHKGGANTGVFLQVTAEDSEDVAIPREKYSFGTLRRAQSLGDLEALSTHGRRAVRLHIAGGVAEGLDFLEQLL